MATLTISSGMTSHTMVSNTFIDKYMPSANGEFVKVYLYILRTALGGGCSVSVSDIADNFNNTENDVIRALNYWSSKGLLSVDIDSQNNISCITLFPIPASSVFEPPIKSASHENEVDRATLGQVNSKNSANSISNSSATLQGATDSTGNSSASLQNVAGSTGNSSASLQNVASSSANDKHKKYSLDEIKAFRQDPDVMELFFIIETYLKRTLSSTDTNLVLFWLDELHFKPDLIEYLVEYCITKGHSSLRYMDKVALGWADSSITTVEQAKAEAATHSQLYYSVMKALGINGRNLVDSEISYINKWSRDFAFDSDIICEACNRTILNIHQPSFEYTDSILTNWHKQNIRTKEDISAADVSYAKTKKTSSSTEAKQSNNKKNKFNNFNQRNHDYDQLEKLFLNSTV